jgi:DNA-binding NtrC family response regulator
VLRDAGYHVIPAADGQEACDIIEKESKEIDLALLDVVMPKVSGKAVHETYLDNKPHGKVVFISGYSKGLIENEIFDQEKMQFLQKPFTPESLLLAIRNTLDA